MTDSSPHRSWRPRSELPTPQDDPALIRTFQGYRAALARMTPEQLLSHATDLSARLEAQSRSTLAALISPGPSGSSSIDDLVIRSPRTDPLSQHRDRGARPSPASPSLPSAVDLLAASKKLAPRIAAKLVQAEARRARAERA